MRQGIPINLWLLVFSVACFFSPSAWSQPVAKLVAGQSSINFAVKQMGVPLNGQFKHFEAKIAFNPKRVSDSGIDFEIDLASASLGAPEVDGELAKSDWFDTARRPGATFHGDSVRTIGPNRFEVAGKLTIKGNTRDVVVPVTLTQSGVTTTANGTFVIRRLDFKIGDREWASTAIVANDVQVTFKLAFVGIGPI